MKNLTSQIRLYRMIATSGTVKVPSKMAVFFDCIVFYSLVERLLSKVRYWRFWPLAENQTESLPSAQPALPRAYLRRKL